MVCHWFVDGIDFLTYHYNLDKPEFSIAWIQNQSKEYYINTTSLNINLINYIKRNQFKVNYLFLGFPELKKEMLQDACLFFIVWEKTTQLISTKFPTNIKSDRLFKDFEIKSP